MGGVVALAGAVVAAFSALWAGVPAANARSPVAALTGPVARAAASPVVYTVGPKATGGSPRGDHVAVGKVEQVVDLEPDQARTVTLSCPSGQTMMDASPEILAVGQNEVDHNGLESVEVKESKPGPGTPRSYLFKIINHATERAQAKVHGTCVTAQTVEHKYPLKVTAPSSQSSTWNGGEKPVTMSCPVGSIPVSPGYEVTSGSAKLTRSEPGPSTNQWTVALAAPAAAPTTATFSIRCLDQWTAAKKGKQARLIFSHKSAQVAVDAKKTATEKSSCDQQAKGLVAQYKSAGTGLVLLGYEPQPRAKVFELFNPTAAVAHPTVGVVCVGDRTASPTS